MANTNTKKNIKSSNVSKPKTNTNKSEVSTEKKIISPTLDEVHEVNEAVAIVTEETVETSPIVGFKAKKKIPLDAKVMVKNATGGELIYVSKRMQGYKEIWNGFGDEVPMEMEELYAMCNTDRKFFTENWIEVDPLVLRDLGMERYYKDAISIDKINDIFGESEDTMIAMIKTMKPSIKNAFALEAIKRIENGTLTNLKTISAIEKTLKCELYEH